MSNFDGELLSAYLDDELSAEERAQLEQRLQIDPRLQGELAELREIIALVQQMPLLKAPRNYTLSPADFQTPRRVYPFRAILAAAAVVVLVTGAVLFMLSGQENAADTAQEAPADIAAAPTQTALLSATQTDNLSVTAVNQATQLAVIPSSLPSATMSATLSPMPTQTLDAQREVVTTATQETFTFAAPAVGEADNAAGTGMMPMSTPTADSFAVQSAGAVSQSQEVATAMPTQLDLKATTVIATEVAAYAESAVVPEEELDAESVEEAANEVAEMLPPGAVADSALSDSDLFSNILGAIKNFFTALFDSLNRIFP